MQYVAWEIRATISTMPGYTPGELVFSKEIIMRIKVVANWEKIEVRKLTAVVTTNQHENRSRLNYNYKIRYKVLLILSDEATSEINELTEGPYAVTKVYRNETVRI